MPTVKFGDVELECSSDDFKKFRLFQWISGVEMDEEELALWKAQREDDEEEEEEEEDDDAPPRSSSLTLVGALSERSNLRWGSSRITPASLADYFHQLLKRPASGLKGKDKDRVEFFFQNPPLFVWSGETFQELENALQRPELMMVVPVGEAAPVIGTPFGAKTPFTIVPISILEAKLLFVAHAAAMETGYCYETRREFLDQNATGEILKNNDLDLKRFLLRSLEQVAYAAAPLPFFDKGLSDERDPKRKAAGGSASGGEKRPKDNGFDFTLASDLVKFLEAVNRRFPEVASDTKDGLGEFVLKRGELGKGGFHCFVRKVGESESDRPMAHHGDNLKEVIADLANRESNVTLQSAATAYAESFYEDREFTHSRPFYVANKDERLVVQHVLDAFHRVDTGVESSAEFYDDLRTRLKSGDVLAENHFNDVGAILSDVTCLVAHHAETSIVTASVSTAYYPTLPALVATRESTVASSSSSSSAASGAPVPVPALRLGVGMVPFFGSTTSTRGGAAGVRRFVVFDANEEFKNVGDSPLTKGVMYKLAGRDALLTDEEVKGAETALFLLDDDDGSRLVTTFVPVTLDDQLQGVLIAVDYGLMPVFQSTVDVAHHADFHGSSFSEWFVDDASVSVASKLLASSVVLRSVTGEFRKSLCPPGVSVITDENVVATTRKFRSKNKADPAASEGGPTSMDVKNSEKYVNLMTAFETLWENDASARLAFTAALQAYTDALANPDVSTRKQSRVYGASVVWKTDPVTTSQYDATEAFDAELRALNHGEIKKKINGAAFAFNLGLTTRGVLPSKDKPGRAAKYPERLQAVYQNVVVPLQRLQELRAAEAQAPTAVYSAVATPEGTAAAQIRRGGNRGRGGGGGRSTTTTTASAAASAPQQTVVLPRVIGGVGLPLGAYLTPEDFDDIAEMAADGVPAPVVGAGSSSSIPGVHPPTFDLLDSLLEESGLTEAEMHPPFDLEDDLDVPPHTTAAAAVGSSSSSERPLTIEQKYTARMYRLLDGDGPPHSDDNFVDHTAMAHALVNLRARVSESARGRESVRE